MPWMSSKVVQAKTVYSQGSSSAGPKGAALDPPRYGIDFIDRQVKTESKTQAPLIQAKLIVNVPGDEYEREADRVAEQVMRMPVGMREEMGEHEKPKIMTRTGIQRAGIGAFQVGDEFERQLGVSRGRGQPLPLALRKQFETKFGADFSGVRIHADNRADELNRSIQAKAFTTGQDVFFAQEAYEPEKPAGQALLAHELTHVVRQTDANVDAAQHIVQRKVGFELELSSWKTWQPKRFYHSVQDAMDDPEKRKPFRKGETILKQTGYELQADELEGGESDMEFVTKPFEETDEAGLESTLQSIHDLCKSMQQRMREAGRSEISFASAMEGRGSPKKKGFFASNGIVEFKPQATGGIKLEALGGLMRDIGAPQEGEPHLLSARLQPGRKALMSMPTDLNTMGPGIKRMGNANPQTRAAIDNYRGLPGVAAALGADWQGSDSLRGLVTLIFTYIEAARYPLPNYAKAIAPIMARTDFASIFKQLPENEKVHFSANNGDEWIRLIEQVPTFGVPGNEVTMQAPLFAGGIYHSKADFNHRILNALTRELWLRGMTQGTDFLTRKHIAATGAGKAAKEQIESLGSLGNKMEKVGLAPTPNGRTNAPIFELRGMEKVDRDDIVTWGRNVLRYFHTVNSGGDSKFGEQFVQ